MHFVDLKKNTGIGWGKLEIMPCGSFKDQISQAHVFKTRLHVSQYSAGQADNNNYC